jgi:chorismate synthase
MRGNSFGKLFSFTSFGESHGPAMGVVIDGVPAGLHFDIRGLKNDLKRRAPGQSDITTSRKEDDEPIILSGIYGNKTLGTPIAIMVENKNAKSADYEAWKHEYRPGHADKTTELKYGIRDHRGGGRSSGRETLCRVIAGYFAKLVLPVNVEVKISQLGPYNPYEGEEQVRDFLLKCKEEGNSVGGTIQVTVKNPPVGLGEPVYDKLKADFAKAFLSIGACTSFSYGLGEEFAHLTGQEATTKPSHFGGMEGGMTNGEDIFMSLTFRAPSTVGEKAQQGRHDPCILPRVLPVVESMTRVVLADHFLRQKAYQI